MPASRRWVPLVVAAVLTLGRGTALVAQVQPMAAGGGGADLVPPLVSLVTPTGDVTTQYALIKIEWCDNSSLDAASRLIKVNGVNRTTSFDYVSINPWDCGARATSSSTTVSLSLGSNTVSAKICDNAGNCTSENFTINRVTPGAPTIALKNQNGDHQDRSLCLTAGAGEAAAVQCGDLLVAHGMPGYRTLGRDRSLTLLYNSATAAPRPAVAVTVTRGAGVQTPDSVYAELKINGVKRASAWYYTWGTPPGSWCRATRRTAIPRGSTRSP